eukprot:4133956-Prymnesium_polylepis.1
MVAAVDLGAVTVEVVAEADVGAVALEVAVVAATAVAEVGWEGWVDLAAGSREVLAHEEVEGMATEGRSKRGSEGGPLADPGCTAHAMIISPAERILELT